MVEYLVKSTICLIVFYLTYILILSKTRQFQFNRYYLIFAILFSLVFPTIHFTIGSPGIMELPNKLIVPQAVTTIKFVSVISDQTQVRAVTKPMFNISSFAILVCVTVSILMLLRFLRNFILLVRNNAKYERVQYNGSVLILTSEKSSPYSFLNFIYVNKQDYQNGLIDNELFLHELAHKKQLHSIDIIFLEIIQIFLWFNPFIYLYKRAVKLNHEYLADYFVLLKGVSHKEYSHKLINFTFRNKGLTLASGFDYLLTKKRLIMISKIKTKRKWLALSISITCIIVIMLSSLAFTSHMDMNQKKVDFLHQKTTLKDSISEKKDKESYLLLHPDQLKPLGIVMNDWGIFYKNYYPYKKHDNKYLGFAFYCDKHNYISSISFEEGDTIRMESSFDKNAVTMRDFYPMLVGDTKGKQSLDNKSVTKDMLLMPISINMAEAKFAERKDTIVVWFKPSESLQRALPKRIKMGDYLRSRPL